MCNTASKFYPDLTELPDFIFPDEFADGLFPPFPVSRAKTLKGIYTDRTKLLSQVLFERQ